MLLTPFISWYYGDRFALPAAVVGAILIDFYFKGERVVLSNYKTAAGVFEQDKFLPLVQGAVNLVLSIVLVQRIGLLGVYIGTIVSGLIANIIRPVIIYRTCFDRKANGYFYDALRYIGVSLLALVICALAGNVVLSTVSLLRMIVMAVIVTVVYNGIFLLFFGRTFEFKYLYGILKTRLK